MKTPLLIGVHGVKRSGKGTVAHFIKEWAQSLSLSAFDCGFADAPKWWFARQFMPDISMEDAIAWCDDFKQGGRLLVIPPHRGFDGYKVFPVDGRAALAQFSTEGGRDIMGDNVWVDHLLPLPGSSEAHVRPPWAEAWPTGTDICTISDLRFENELNRIDLLGGYSIKVTRQVAEDAVLEEAKQLGREVHRSELGLHQDDFDAVIPNDGSLEELQEQVNFVMENAKHQWERWHKS